MTGILLTQSTTPIIAQVAWILGKIMNGIYIVMDSLFGIENIGICIILFTIIIYIFMVPLTYKQQKFSRMSAIMNPELQKIQKKYANKKDQMSMQKQQEEIQAVYEKYGTSPTGGCGQMLVQFPILFALYAVIRNIPAYVTSVKEVYTPLINGIMSTNGFQKTMEAIGEAKPVLMSANKYDYTQADTLIGVIYKFQSSTWNTLIEKFPDLTSVINDTMTKVDHINSFLGISIAETPMTVLKASLKTGAVGAIVISIAIPVLSGITQYINVKLTPTANTKSDDPTMKQMNSMMATMPIISVVMCFTLPAGLGIYWIASAVVRTIQMIIINKHLDKTPMEEIIEKNREKAKKKREKKGASADRINKLAQQSTRNVESEQEVNPNSLKEKNKKMSGTVNDEKLQKAYEKNKNAKAGSLASKANMVRDFNENKK
jgi:YidC/Oxa1 family membrane protein insertase